MKLHKEFIMHRSSTNVEPVDRGVHSDVLVEFQFNLLDRPVELMLVIYLFSQLWCIER